MEELNKTIKEISTNNASNLDGIPVVFWKSDILLEPLPSICNQTFNLDKPDMWSKGDIIHFPFPSYLGDKL